MTRNSADETSLPTGTARAADALPQQIARLSGLIASEALAGADRAALKRWAPGQPPPLTFYRLWLGYIGDELPPQTQAWMLVAWGLAFGVAHRRERPLGLALAESRYAEGRVERLLAATPDVLPELWASTVRFLAAKGEAIDWLDAAQLLLTHEPEKRERLHRRIASHYYGQLARIENTVKE